MGDAFTALAEGPAAVWWNPAALATGPQLALEPYGNSRLIPDLADDIWIHYFSAAGRQRGLGVGANLNYLNYGEPEILQDRDEPNDEEYALRVGAGLDLTPFVAPEAERFQLALGASWNRFVVDYRLFSLFPPPGVTREHATAWDMDVGALATFCTPIEPRPSGMRPSNYILRGGLVLGNVFDHELDLVSSPNTPVGQTFRAGLAAGGDFMDTPRGYVARVRIAADRTSEHGKARSDDVVYNFGYELTLLEFVSVRQGRVDNHGGAIEDWGYGFGVGHEFHEVPGVHSLGFQFDYARIPQAADMTKPTHISFTVHSGF